MKVRAFREFHDYGCWLNYPLLGQGLLGQYTGQFQTISVDGDGLLRSSIEKELCRGIGGLLGCEPFVLSLQANGIDGVGAVGEAGALADVSSAAVKVVRAPEEGALGSEGYQITIKDHQGSLQAVIRGSGERGCLYGTFAFLRLLQMGEIRSGLQFVDAPKNALRMINHWDNLDGSVERGYAGRSIFFEGGELTRDVDRVRDYARLLASVGINGVAVNNVNVHAAETQLIASRIEMVKSLAEIFREYGIRLFLSINYASPLEFGLDTADPLDARVRAWWKDRVKEVYRHVPDLGGFLVKADSEHRPGPFTYGRTQADGANMLGEALEPFGGVLIWRCFVYNCQQDWRDKKTDRARAAYDYFKPLDGQFRGNVILQIKNGPMDFQVREPVSPLFGGMEETNQILELQITQEYTGQQRHLCYLVPQWKEILGFDTYASGSGSTVADVISSGMAAVANVGDDANWTGHTLAQANLYGYSRLSWDPELLAEKITAEWIVLTFGSDPEVLETLSSMLLSSWEIYENYTTPLGIGWMCNPNHHYGPNVDGYEYSKWGTYHRANHLEIGVDRTVEGGTGYVGQYRSENARLYESLESCPEELLLFFHRVPYTYNLKTGKTLIQHIYDSHFLGVEQVKGLLASWRSVKGKVDHQTYSHVLDRLEEQLNHSKEWRDVINTYFYRISGIGDSRKREIY